MAWSTVSTAALRSSNTRIGTCCLFMSDEISCTTLSSAVCAVWNANTVTYLLMSIICIRDTIISSTHTFMSGPSMNILTYFPYIRSPLTNILRAYCDIRSVFFIISRAFVDMYSARFTMCCQNFVICGSFSYRLALRSLRLTACGP